MNLKAPFVKRFVLAFLISLTVSGAFYFAFFSYYITPVLAAAESLVNLLFPSIRLTVLSSPTSLEKNLGVIIGAMIQLAVPCNLFVLVTNVIFAPSLVLATFGFTRKGFGRALAAIVIMIVVHALTIMIFVLDVINNQHGAYLPAPFPEPVVGFIQVVKHFLVTQFSYVLPPFLIWILLCFEPLSRLFSDVDQPADPPVARPADRSPRRR